MNAFIVSQGRHPGRREQNSQSFPTRGIFWNFVCVGQTKASWIPWYLPWSWDTDALDSQSGKGNAGLLASSISGAPCLGSRKVSCFGLLLRCNCSVGLLPYSILISLLPSFSFSCRTRVDGYLGLNLLFLLSKE